MAVDLPPITVTVRDHRRLTWTAEGSVATICFRVSATVSKP